MCVCVCVCVCMGVWVLGWWVGGCAVIRMMKSERFKVLKLYSTDPQDITLVLLKCINSDDDMHELSEFYGA